MHLRVLQRRRQAVGADEMFLRDEQTGPGAGFPLDGLLELLRGAIELHCDRRLRGRFRRNRPRSDQLAAELDGVPPDKDSGNEKENRRSDNHRAIVICLKPIDCFPHSDSLTTNEHEFHKTILSHSSLRCLKLRITPTRRPVIRR